MTTVTFRYNPETDTNHYFSYNEENGMMTEKVTSADVHGEEEIIEEKSYVPTERQLFGVEWEESGKIKQV